jgi:mutator protein MutT
VKLIPVGLCLFYRQRAAELEVWVQRREDDGIYHGLLEFPGGGIEAGETPLSAMVREVQEEVGIALDPARAQFMGLYPNAVADRNVLLYVYLYRDDGRLEHQGQWLKIDAQQLSTPFLGQIPSPNHQILDDLFRAMVL